MKEYPTTTEEIEQLRIRNVVIENARIQQIINDEHDRQRMGKPQPFDSMSPDVRAYIERTAKNQVLDIMIRSLIPKERFAELLVELAEEIRQWLADQPR